MGIHGPRQAPCDARHFSLFLLFLQKISAIINLFPAEILGRRGLGERKNSKVPAVLLLLSAVFVGAQHRGDGSSRETTRGVMRPMSVRISQQPMFVNLVNTVLGIIEIAIAPPRLYHWF